MTISISRTHHCPSVLCHQPLNFLKKIAACLVFWSFIQSTTHAVDTRPTTNLWVWLYSSNGVVKDGLNNVTGWVDQNINSQRNASASGLKSPLYETSQINGKAGVYFSRSGYEPSMNISAAAGNSSSSNMTIIVVAKNAGSGVSPIISTGLTNGWLLQYSAGPKIQYIHNTASAPTSSNTHSLSLGSSSWSILEMRRTSGSIIKLGNNGRMGDDATGNPKTISNFTPSSGASVLGKIGTFNANVKIAEILVYDGVLSAADRQTIYTTLSSFYAISLNNSSPSASAVTAKIGSTNISSGTQLLQPTGQIDFFVTASDDSSITKVEFYRGSTLIGTDTTPTNNVYSVPLVNLAAGSYAINAKAYDDLGAIASTSSFSFSVVNPAPTISAITATQNSYPISSGVSLNQPTGTLAFSATATDNTGIAKVEFYNGASLLYTATTGISNVFTYSSSNFSSGSKSLTAKAYDTGSPITTATSPVFSLGIVNRQPEVASVGGIAPSSSGAVTLQSSSYVMTLSVQAYDSNQTTLDGEGTLTYTWAAAPSGATFTQPTLNGTNAGRSMPTQFNAIGSYQFQVTVRDTGNQVSVINILVNVTSLDTLSTDSDGDGWLNSDEINLYGTSSLDADTDHDGYNDPIDAFPLDRARWSSPTPVPGDIIPPDIEILEPIDAVRI